MLSSQHQIKDQMHSCVTEHCLVHSITFDNGVGCPEIFSAVIHFNTVNLLHVSRQVHFHGNTRIWQRENMQKIGSAFMQCFRNHCYMYYDSLCRETLAACYRCSYEEIQGIFPKFNSCSSEISARLIRNISRLCRCFNCPISPPPHLHIHIQHSVSWHNICVSFL